jgi:hypothetical protein
MKTRTMIAAFAAMMGIVLASTSASALGEDFFIKRAKEQIRQKYTYKDARDGSIHFKQASTTTQVISRYDTRTGKPIFSTRTTYDNAALKDLQNYSKDSTYNRALKQVEQEVRDNNWFARRRR